MILLDIINGEYAFRRTSNNKAVSKTHEELGAAKIFFPKTVTYDEVTNNLGDWLMQPCTEGKTGDKVCYFCGCDGDTEDGWTSFEDEAKKILAKKKKPGSK